MYNMQKQRDETPIFLSTFPGMFDPEDGAQRKEHCQSGINRDRVDDCDESRRNKLRKKEEEDWRFVTQQRHRAAFCAFS